MRVDWSGLFVPSGSIAELVIRGSVIYLATLAILRILRRGAGELNRADLLVLLLVADAAQNGMAGEYRSITEGLILVGTIFAWNYALDWMSYRSPLVHRLLEAPPLLLVRDGKVLARNLRAELLTPDDLMEQLREQGVATLAEVRRCFVESDGKLSVIRRQAPAEPRRPRERAR